jgi:hypothetical protein
MALLPSITIIFAIATLITILIHLAKDTAVPLRIPVLFAAITLCLMVLPR